MITAIDFAEAELWRELDYNERAHLNLVVTDLLCMPFGEFHEAVEKVADHGVWTHQFIDKALMDPIAAKTQMTANLRKHLLMVGVVV